MNKFFKVYASKRMLSTLLLGFSGGLPLMLATSTTVQAWMADAKIDLATIGYFALVGLPYALKFVWAPFLDVVKLPGFGLRRGWLLFTQLGLVLSILAMAQVDPAARMDLFALMAFLVSLFSASQDIVIDAYRIEILEGEEELGAGAGVYVAGYRLAMLMSGGLALVMADHMSWTQVYMILAMVQTSGMVTAFLSGEPKVTRPARKFNFKNTVVAPFADFFQRTGAMEILLFIMIYKLSTLMATALTTKFLKDLGFTNTVIGMTNKAAGISGTIIGTLIGGVLMSRLKVKRSLWIFGIIQAFVGPLFGLLSYVDPGTPWGHVALVVIVFTDNFMMGLGTAALTGFMMNFTNKQFTATQYALMTSVLAVARVILIAQAGVLAQTLGWHGYFFMTVPLALPGLMLLFQYDSWHARADKIRVTFFLRAQITVFMISLFLLVTPPLWKYFGNEEMSHLIEKAGAVGIFIVVMAGVLRPWMSHLRLNRFSTAA